MEATSPRGSLIGYALLLVALLTASVLVLPGLASRPLEIDEHVSYWISGAENPGTIGERSLNYAATPPFSSFVQRGFLALGGKSTFWFRLPSVLGFLSAVVFTFLFARELLGPLPAGLAGQLLVWHPGLVDQMRQARPYGISVGLAAWLLWLTVRWCRTSGNIGLMFLWTFAAGALIWTHYLNLPLVGLVLIWLLGLPYLAIDGWKRPGWQLAVACGLLALSLLPLVPSLIRMQEWSPFLNFRTELPPFWKGVGPYWWLTLPVGFCGGWSLTRADRGSNITLPLRTHLAVLMLCGLLPTVLLGTIPVGSLATLAEPRYRLIYIPASVVLLSGCLLQRRNWIAALLASAIGIGCAWWILGERPWISNESSASAAANWRELSVQLQQGGQPHEPIFVYSGLIESRLIPALFKDELFHDYVACRAGRFIIETPHPRYALPWFWTPETSLVEFYKALLQESSNQVATPVWLIASTDTDLGRESVERFQELVAQHGYRETERTTTRNAVLIKLERIAIQ